MSVMPDGKDFEVQVTETDGGPWETRWLGTTADNAQKEATHLLNRLHTIHSVRVLHIIHYDAKPPKVRP